jgi:hypothetical protein
MMGGIRGNIARDRARLGGGDGQIHVSILQMGRPHPVFL